MTTMFHDWVEHCGIERERVGATATLRYGPFPGFFVVVSMNYINHDVEGKFKVKDLIFFWLLSVSKHIFDVTETRPPLVCSFSLIKLSIANVCLAELVAFRQKINQNIKYYYRWQNVAFFLLRSITQLICLNLSTNMWRTNIKIR